MKHSITLLIILFAFAAQGQKKAEKLFQKAISNYESGNYYDAATDFQEIAENHKRFKYHDQCFYNTAYSYHQADSLTLAITWYEKIRASNLKDDNRVGGRGILEPYANYKHYSTFNIATIEYNRENYEKALEYYRQSLEKYPYYNESGTDLRTNKNQLTIYVSDCLEKLEKYEEALLTIVPEALDSKRSSNYESVVKRSIEIITDHFDKEKIQQELSTALETLEKNEKEGSYSITIRNKKIKLFPYWLDDDSIDGLKKEIIDSEFWKKLIEE
ncbi:tetratricopeptide repeat protein [Croceimicrobium hydrocarbonivorans]|uniref:Tetratricopeptide repeat protein n=1 Tax=Croceimicrobium hydrocarbonivorans TaxID=2761580 RepID=A0A7H0VHC7_9FLAO|nr:tetratricopeptide repeat protein [Croceimicrobium hydrocarbonivorans]QNR25125.1 tetratricopeptide repeat protein [Croceimicrobium hydrocarbonivorans]